jgi:hypothetical protein
MPSKNYFCTVKLLTALLAFYLLLLPIVPCSDIDEGNRQEQPVVSAAASHSDHQDNDEGCNPFCNCSCCGQIFTPVFLAGKTIPVKPITKKRRYFYRATAFLPGYSGAIWQPPKLS